MGGSFAQMRHPLCLPEHCDNVCVSAHEQAPVWADITTSALGTWPESRPVAAWVLGFRVPVWSPVFSSSVTSVGATETSRFTMWVDPQSHSFLGKDNSAKSPTTEWAKDVSCVLEG